MVDEKKDSKKKKLEGEGYTEDGEVEEGEMEGDVGVDVEEEGWL